MVVAFDDLFVDFGFLEWLPARSALDKEFKFVLGVEALNLARRVLLIVPDVVLVAVGEEDDGPDAKFGF